MYFSNTNETDSIWNRISALRLIYVFLFSVTLAHGASNWKSLNHGISDEKKNGPTKYVLEKILYPRNIHEKNVFIPEIHIKKGFGPKKSVASNFFSCLTKTLILQNMFQALNSLNLLELLVNELRN